MRTVKDFFDARKEEINHITEMIDEALAQKEALIVHRRYMQEKV
jgi:hypothetical protein